MSAATPEAPPGSPWPERRARLAATPEPGPLAAEHWSAAVRAAAIGDRDEAEYRWARCAYSAGIITDPEWALLRSRNGVRW